MGAFTDWLEIGRMDALGRMDTPVHRLDARAKIFTTLVFIVVVMSFPRHEMSALTPMAFFPVAMITIGRIPPGVILRKIAVASPFAIMVGMFNPILDHTPVFSIGSWVVTAGWLSFFSILFRFALTVSAALALIACTGMFRIGAGLEQLGAPRLFVMQLLFLYRYLFVVADEGITMLRSVQARCPGMRSLPLKIYGSLTGHLLMRSLDRADRIHRSMVARGFDGHIQTLQRPGLTGKDILFVVTCTTLFIIARTWNLAEIIGVLFVE
jgi:cobalt/nickel transport system permease protein